MSQLPYGPPQNVSPLIRGARIVMFVSGIVWARVKTKKYNWQERRHLIDEAKKQVIRDKHNAELKKQIAKEEAAMVKEWEAM